MTFSFSKDFSSSITTCVENQFITEYLPLATDSAVKVYLYGLFLCSHPERDRNIKEVADDLKLNENEVIESLKFWEDFGILTIVSLEPFTVQYLPVRQSAGSKPRKIKSEKYTEFTKSLQGMITSRMISTNEYSEYFNIMEIYGIKPEALLMIVKYCMDIKGESISYRYVSTVAKNFANEGATTVESLEKKLSSYVAHTYELEEIITSLSLKRKPDIDDLNLYEKWTKELCFEPANIIYVAKTLKKSTMEKLDKILLELYSIKSFSKEEIADFLKKKQNIKELAVKINKALSVYVQVLETEIENYISKWVSYGYSEETLLLIANHCFLDGKNTLNDMDSVVSDLNVHGFIDLLSVHDFFEQIKTADTFISKILLTAGVNRRPTPWDRENLERWKSWNFSEDMILEASRLSAGKSSPISYMQSILSNWKNKGTFTLNDLGNITSTSLSQEEYNREYSRRRSLAVSKAQKNIEMAMEIDGFQAIYERLSSIEKDLAFAEISGNSEQLNKLEQEKQEKLDNASALLKSIDLTLNDLTPKYHCEKCNDTGYIGTHRCDCINDKI